MTLAQTHTPEGAVYSRRVGRTVLCVYPERRSTNLRGTWTRSQVARRRVDNDQTPHGNLEYVPVCITVAPEESFAVYAAANRSRGRVPLGHGMTREQAIRYVDAYRPGWGLLDR